MQQRRARGGPSHQALWNRMELVRRQFERTATVAVPHPRVKLFAKLESANPAGSAKDRSAYWILREAVRRGEITSTTTVVESSSGNFALSLALFCRTLGVEFIPVVDPNANKSTVETLRRLCSRVERVETRDSSGGFLMGRLARVAELLEEIGDAYWTDQYSNLDGARGHYELTGGELVESLPRIDYLVVAVGTGASIAGLSQRVKEASPDAAVLAVDVEGSVIFGGPPKRRDIPGMGSSMKPPLIDHALIDDVVTVSEWDQVAGCRALSSKGIFAGGSTGGVYTAVDRCFDGHRGPPPVVAFLCVDSGEAYRETVYDARWVSQHVGPPGGSSSAPPAPVPVHAR